MMMTKGTLPGSSPVLSVVLLSVAVVTVITGMGISLDHEGGGHWGAHGFAPPPPPPPACRRNGVVGTAAPLRSYSDDSPSDYDPSSVVSDTRRAVSVADDREEDDAIREELKKELMVLASITNRGEYASPEERDIAIDLVTQLEALNPTADPASGCTGDWDLVLSSTQFFRASPFFQSLRSALGDDNRAIGENFFELHDRATTAGRIGRVRQSVLATTAPSPSSSESQEKRPRRRRQTLTSEVDLEVGILPGLPFKVKGTVVTTAVGDVTAPETMEISIQSTLVKGSNIPVINQLLEDWKVEVPVGDVYRTILQGTVPTVRLKTFYVDDGIRITRDEDDHFFVWSRV